MLKPLFTIFLALFTTLLSAQTNMKDLFQGNWERETKFNVMSLAIKFEKGTNEATIIDYGSGEAPPITWKANLVGKKLIHLPENGNDYIEMEVKNHRLYLRQREWSEKMNEKKKMVTTVFRKAKKICR